MASSGCVALPSPTPSPYLLPHQRTGLHAQERQTPLPMASRRTHVCCCTLPSTCTPPPARRQLLRRQLAVHRPHQRRQEHRRRAAHGARAHVHTIHHTTSQGRVPSPHSGNALWCMLPVCLISPRHSTSARYSSYPTSASSVKRPRTCTTYCAQQASPSRATQATIPRRHSPAGGEPAARAFFLLVPLHITPAVTHHQPPQGRACCRVLHRKSQQLREPSAVRGAPA